MISAVTRISPSGRDSAECDVSYYHVPRSTGEIHVASTSSPALNMLAARYPKGIVTIVN